MARIPTANDLPAPGISAGIAMPDLPRADLTSSAAAANKAIGALGDSISGAVKIGVKEQQDADDYEMQKRFVDFDLAQDRKLEEAKAAAPADPSGFTGTFRASYDADAKNFFGEGGQNVPGHLREKYDLQMVKRGADYEKRALDFEMAGRERFHRDDLDGKLREIENGTLANPDPIKMRENIARSISLIQTARIPNDRKMEMMRKVAGSIEQTAVRARIDRGDPPEQILADLKVAPKVEDSQREGAGPTDAGLDFIRQKEGYSERAVWDHQQYSSGYGTKAAPGEVITKEEAEVRLRSETAKVGAWLDKNITVPLPDIARDGLISFGYNLGTDDLDKLKGDINAGDWNRVAERMRTFNRASGRVLPGLTERRLAEAAMVQNAADMVPEGAVEVAQLGPVDDASNAPKEERDAPYRYMSPHERSVLMNVVRERGRADIGASVASDISKIEIDGLPKRDADGRTSLDRAKEFMTPHQYEELSARWKAAQVSHAAVSPLADMRPDEYGDHLAAFTPGLSKEDGGPEISQDDYPAYAKANLAMQRKWAKIQEVRRKDPATSVGDSKEVRQAGRAIKAAQAEVDENGFPSGDPSKQLTGPQAWGVMFDARKAAMTRRGIPALSQRLVTKEEAVDLLGAHDPNQMDTKALKDSLELAKQKAIKRYGPAYGPRALIDAMSFQHYNKGDVGDRADSFRRSLLVESSGPAAGAGKADAMEGAESAGRFAAPPPPAAAPRLNPEKFDREKAKDKGAMGRDPTQEEVDVYKKRLNPTSQQMFEKDFGKEALVKYLLNDEKVGGDENKKPKAP